MRSGRSRRAGWSRGPTGRRGSNSLRPPRWRRSASRPISTWSIGRHSAETHSLGAAVLAATLAASLRWPLARSRGRIWAAAFVAWFSHPLLDVLGTDTTAPFGVMLFWPLSQVHVLSGLAIFAAISRHWHQPGFAIHDLAAALRELLVLGPVAALVWGARHRPAAGHDADAVHAPGPPAGRGDATGAVG